MNQMKIIIIHLVKIIQLIYSLVKAINDISILRRPT